jgi:hypothetical protein
MNGWEWSCGAECDGRTLWQGVTGDARATLVRDTSGWHITVWDDLCDWVFEWVWTAKSVEVIIEIIEAAEHPSMWVFPANRPTGFRVVSTGI